MAKNKLAKQPNFEDFPVMLEDEGSYENHEAINTMVGNIFQAANQQVQSAIGLTKIIIDKTMSDNHATEEKILETYRKALQVITSTSPLEKLMEKLG